MPIYQNSIIYKLKHSEDYDDTNIYVGSTTNFRLRKNGHKSSCNNEKDKHYNVPVYQYIRANGNWEQFVMIPIEQYPCNNKDELKIRERYYIDLLRSTLNRNIPGRTQKEYCEYNKEIIAEKHQEYYEANKETFKKNSKQYREDNKKKLAECKKQYYEDNKDKILEKTKEYNENNKEKKMEYLKIYRNDNKEQIAEKRKEKGKVKVICDHCCCEVRTDCLKRHQKSKKCINFVKTE